METAFLMPAASGISVPRLDGLKSREKGAGGSG